MSHVLPFLPLNAGRAALRKLNYLIKGRHRCIARERGEQCAVRPTEVDGLLRLLTAEQAIDEACGEAVAAADTVKDAELGGGRLDRLAVDPRHGAPTVLIRVVDFAQRGRND